MVRDPENRAVLVGIAAGKKNTYDAERSMDELAGVHGIGQSRLDAYGEEILAAINSV